MGQYVARQYRRVLLASLSLSTLLGSHAGAAGIGVAPAYRHVDVYEGQRLDVPVRIINRTTQALDFKVDLADFTSIDESGGPLIKTDDSHLRYGLRQGAVVSPRQLSVLPGKSAEVIVAVNANHELEAGGHYGAVLFTVQAPSGDRTVTIDQTITALISVTKKGGDFARFHLKEFTARHSLSNLPSRAEVVITNVGNTQSIPEGAVTVTDHMGKELFRSQINPTRGMILPETARRFVLDVNAAALWPGLYTVKVEGNFERSAYSVWIFPVWTLIAGAVAGLLMLGGLGYLWWRHLHPRVVRHPVVRHVAYRGRQVTRALQRTSRKVVTHRKKK